MVCGLALFGLGSIGCGLAQNISQLIVARMVQGTGAVGSVALAALADLTRPTVRTQAFTITGIAIGSAFMIGILGGPLLAASIGLSGLFYILAALGFLSMVLAAVAFPPERQSVQHEPPCHRHPLIGLGPRAQLRVGLMQLPGEMGPVVAAWIAPRLDHRLVPVPPPGDEWVHALVGCLGHVTRWLTGQGRVDAHNRNPRLDLR